MNEWWLRLFVKHLYRAVAAGCVVVVAIYLCQSFYEQFVLAGDDGYQNLRLATHSARSDTKLTCQLQSEELKKVGFTCTQGLGTHVCFSGYYPRDPFLMSYYTFYVRMTDGKDNTSLCRVGVDEVTHYY